MENYNDEKNERVEMTLDGEYIKTLEWRNDVKK